MKAKVAIAGLRCKKTYDLCVQSDETQWARLSSLYSKKAIRLLSLTAKGPPEDATVLRVRMEDLTTTEHPHSGMVQLGAETRVEAKSKPLRLQQEVQSN